MTLSLTASECGWTGSASRRSALRKAAAVAEIVWLILIYLLDRGDVCHKQRLGESSQCKCAFGYFGIVHAGIILFFDNIKSCK